MKEAKAKKDANDAKIDQYSQRIDAGDLDEKQLAKFNKFVELYLRQREGIDARLTEAT